jgi:hypothetical protein
MHPLLWLSFLSVSAHLLPACGAQTEKEAQSGSSTSFLQQCNSHEDCGDLQCLCGRCTVSCENNGECRDLDAEATCGVPSEFGLECEDALEQACVTPSLEPSLTEANENNRCAPVVASPSVECALEFCYPDRLDIVVDEVSGGRLDCTAPLPAEACGGGGDYQAFEYRGDSVYAYVSFDASIVDNYSAESVNAAFSYVRFEVYFHHDGLEYYVQTEPVRADDPALTNLDYVDERLELSVDLGELDGVSREIESSEETCFADDILERCYCTYTIEPTPTTVTLSLPMQTR